MIASVGIDASLTHTGVCALVDGEAHPETWKPGKLRGVDRLAYFRDRFRELFEVHWELVFALEGYSFGSRNGRETAGELGGVVRLAAYDAGIPGDRLLVVPPSTLKKYVTGKGTADKAVMLLHVYKRWGFETADHNVADAYALARFASAAAAPKDSQTKAFRQLLLKTRVQEKVKR